MNDNSPLLKILNFLSLLILVIEIAYKVFFRNLTLSLAIVSSPGNIITILIWIVTLFLWLKSEVMSTLKKFDDEVVQSIEIVTPFIYVCLIGGLLVANIYIIFKYELITSNINPKGYLWIFLADVAAIHLIALIDGIVNYIVRGKYSNASSGSFIDDDLVYLWPARALLISYILLAVIDGFSNAMPENLFTWILTGTALSIFMLVMEAIEIILAIISALLSLLL